MDKFDVLLVGAGYMAEEYLKVLAFLNKKVVVVGRNYVKTQSLQHKFPQFEYHSGGIEKYLENNLPPRFTINTVSVNQLRSTTVHLLKAGAKYILLEKPGDLNSNGLQDLLKIAKEKKSTVLVAYNRRFYASIIELQSQLLIDGGILSIHFEFTEWVHTIDTNQYEEETLDKWIIANSSHVIDTVFTLIGLPKKLYAQVHGQNIIEWHPSGSIFIGSGISNKDVPFTYHSNWNSPGRWSIEILTKKRRFYLKPMESLQVQLLGSVSVDLFELSDTLDKNFKPGLFLQTSAFLERDFSKFCTLDEQEKMIACVYNKISGY